MIEINSDSFKTSPEAEEVKLNFQSSKRAFRIITDTKDMASPGSKVEKLVKNSSTFKVKINVSLKEISEFLGICNSSRLAVLQAPIHYQYLQRQLIQIYQIDKGSKSSELSLPMRY